MHESCSDALYMSRLAWRYRFWNLGPLWRNGGSFLARLQTRQNVRLGCAGRVRTSSDNSVLFFGLCEYV